MLVLMELSRIKGLERIDGEKGLYQLKREQCMMHAPFEIIGSPSWVRTSDLRINSPSLYRLSYRGIKTANFTEARLECQIFKIIQMLPNVKSEKSNCWEFSLQR